VESTRKWITLDLAVGEQVVVGDAIATVLEIDGDQATIIVEHLDYE
jgi:sRNA-binding carbon storage regulator CsrA